MSPYPDDLTGMKDDMTAFIEGQGMRRFFGWLFYRPEDQNLHIHLPGHHLRAKEVLAV